MVSEAVETDISNGAAILLAVVAIVMALALWALFRERRRLLPLALALVVAALTFGAMSVAGASLTIASIAVLPVLVGLVVSYGILFVRERRDWTAIGVASGATAAALLVLLLSPIPMVRGFGALLVIGMVLAFAVFLTLGFALVDGGESVSAAFLT